ncbi:MAG: hypothetical protein CK538_10535 [Opitutia bacterium]|nr:DUF1800 family protein [Opitutaceae bacterium]PHX84726.1 MAG: hypothetical protein CK538_10535 [Opitutae bacterium]
MKSLLVTVAFALLLAPALHAQEPRLANISTRANSGTGADVLTAGFVIGPGANKQVLIRAVGPTLSAFGLAGTLADPVLTLFNSANTAIATNDNWLAADAATFASVGAFTLPANSRDSALVATLAPGNYTAQIAGAGATTGVALVEVYELGATATKLLNTSTRLQISPTSLPIIGLVVSPGSGTRKLLLRAAGPALNAFGLTGTLADPTLSLTRIGTVNAVIATNDNWSTPTTASAATATTLTNAFTTAGAFAFTAGSRDAALLIDLAAGNYGIQVSGVAATSGLALVEVYDLTANTPPTITSAPANVVATAGQRATFTVQATGTPAPAYQWQKNDVNISGATASTLVLDPAQSADAGRYTVVLTNIAGTLTSTAASLTVNVTPAFTAQPTTTSATLGQTATLSVTVSGTPPPTYQWQKNGAAIPGATGATLTLNNLSATDAGNYSVVVTNVAGSTTSAPFTLTPAGPPTITLAATKATADESGSNAGEFTVTRTGEIITTLTVNYAVSGTATNGLDYPPLLGSITIPVGASSAKIPLPPFPDTSVEPTETVIVTLAAGSGYLVGASASGTVSIADSPGTLYVANLRPSTIGSTASGLATIVLSASGTVATVNVAFSNLSSGQAGAHLFLGNSTSSGDYVLNLPLGQISGTQWTIAPTATYTSAQILSALTNGLIFVGLDTGNFPTGELRGAFLTAVGSQVFTAPAAAPAVALTSTTATDAARLLTQATYGPKKSEIDALTGGSLDAWITTQLATATPLTHRAAGLAEWAATKADDQALGGDPNDVDYNFSHRRRGWFPVALAGPDQLRQRVAFALSQILVISDTTLARSLNEGISLYWDQLAAGAFGNYRILLEQATLSPVMGTYLSHLRNAKADPVAGTNPDENYARELMQLFTIGLVQLHPDGTLKLDAQGLPIPTYNQTTITETAKILTGFGFFNTNPTTANFRTTRGDFINPMTLYLGFHESAQKIIVSSTSPSGTSIPANLGGTEDLKRLLDTLFNHTNTPPFVCRQLIQRLVTDNPSPAYVYRVSQKFVDNGSGVRGDLGSVVRAILTDYEARSPVAAAVPGYGKLKEPLLRFTGLLRSFNAASPNGRNSLDNLTGTTFQAAQQAPSVFNFFEPGYVYPGALAAAGLVAPEFQITDATSAITVPNLLYTYTVIPVAATNPNFNTTYALDLTAETTALATSVSALLDRLSQIMCANQMSAATKTRLTTALNALPATTTSLDKVRNAVYLVATSPDGAIQK